MEVSTAPLFARRFLFGRMRADGDGCDCRYFLKAIKWARKYGLRIKLDLHTMPGSQNG